MSFVQQPQIITNPQNIPVTITANSAGPYLPGVGYTWQVTDLDSYVTYTVTAQIAGTATINTSTGVITYTPAAGSTGFNINGRFVPISVATVPGAPTIGTATINGTSSASVTFTAGSTGGTPITGYTVTASSGQTATGASSPITVTGLPQGTNITFQVKATNAVGTGPNSSASNAINLPVQGQTAYTTPGTYTWVAPAGVTSVSVVAVGGGGGNSGDTNSRPGGGGALAYGNNISVTGGNSYTVVVGAAGTTTSNGGDSTFINSSSLNGGGGTYGRNPFSYPTQGNGGVASGSLMTAGYSGGNSGWIDGGAGGAGGYAGAGGRGGKTGSGVPEDGQPGTGGAGGGGGSGDAQNGGGGGGVGILGQGTSGAGGLLGNGGSATGGGGGSGGTNGGNGSSGNGGLYGGGCTRTGSANVGAVRIIWPGATRYFPSTGTADV